MLLPKQVVSFSQLRSEGLSGEEIKSLYAKLKLFPTPFKGIYYVPSEEERKGTFIQKPLKALFQALTLFLGNEKFYFSCRTAEENIGIEWHESGTVHIVNKKLSKKIKLSKRIEQNNKKDNWRSKKVARLLSLYGNELILHKTANIEGAKTKRTPYGRFALRVQIKNDMKKFREIKP